MIKSIRVVSDDACTASKVRRRYEFVFTDLIDVDHRFVVGRFTVDKADTGEAQAAKSLIDIKEQEKYYFISEIEDGRNPFTENIWNTRNELIKHILDKALSENANEMIVRNGLQFLPLVTDSELMIMYSESQAWVDNLRAKSLGLITNSKALNDYVPILQDSEAV